MKFKKLAAVLAAATMLSTGVVPVMAAETVSVEPTAHQVMEIQEAIESDVKIQSEVRAANDTKAAIEDEFDLGTLGKDGVYTSGTAKISALSRRIFPYALPSFRYQAGCQDSGSIAISPL